MKRLITLLLVFTFSITLFGQTQNNYDLNAANGNGFRFWNGSNNYKIHMGNTSEYKYGPVTDYSIKTNMTIHTPGRGWTWGVNGQVPIAALNSIGNFQIEGSLYTMGRIGIGTVSPTSLLHIKSQTGQTENLASFQVEDASADYLQITNFTGAPGQFIPLIKGFHQTDNRYSLAIMGQTSVNRDNGSNAIVLFDARRPSGPIQTRPLFVWTSYTTKMMTMLANGNLGIGTTNPGAYKLAVKGKIRAEEIKVETGWADYVFKDDYDLPTLEEVENHIKEKGHLINIPSAEEVKKNGIELGGMNKLLLEKIEELTLYTLEQEKKIHVLQEVNETIKILLLRIEKLENTTN